jgi:ATP-binding cassette, subfamily B, heavy metal transporter
VVDAHEIVVLEAGRVVERGPHAELLARDGRYAQMWRLQQSGDEDRGAAPVKVSGSVTPLLADAK